jgi:cysteine desulfurase/selenocysteine lyase
MTIAHAPSELRRPLDVRRIREDFPILRQRVHGNPLVYLDNAATTQKPASVIEAIQRYYAETNSNVHRGVHSLSEQATAAYEAARVKVQRFIHAGAPSEIVFTRNTTEGINLVASTFGRSSVGEGDEVLISAMEHHSNIVPWQMLCEERGARLRVAPIDDRGELMLDDSSARGRRWWQSRICRTPSARSCPSRRLSRSRTGTASPSSSTARRPPTI